MCHWSSLNYCLGAYERFWCLERWLYIAMLYFSTCFYQWVFDTRTPPSHYKWRVRSQKAIKTKVKKLRYPCENIDDRQENTITLPFVFKMRCTHLTYRILQINGSGIVFPVYRRCFRGGNSIFSLWRLSCFVTKLFKCRSQSAMLCVTEVH